MVKKNWSYTSIERPRLRAGSSVSYLPFVLIGMKRELSLPYFQNKYKKCTRVLSTDRFQTACVFSFLILDCKLEVSDVKLRNTVWMTGDWFPAGASAIVSNQPSLLNDVERSFIHYRESDWSVNQTVRLNFIPRSITIHFHNTRDQGSTQVQLYVCQPSEHLSCNSCNRLMTFTSACFLIGPPRNCPQSSLTSFHSHNFLSRCPGITLTFSDT
jgi:hypothetical protein